MTIRPNVINDTNDSDEYLTPEDTKTLIKAHLQRESNNLRKEFITIFGLFAAFLTFTVLQIQALIQATEMALIMGASSFFVASSLTFVLALHNLFNSRAGWSDFAKPIVVFIALFFFFSFQCFWYATHDGHLWIFN